MPQPDPKPYPPQPAFLKLPPLAYAAGLQAYRDSEGMALGESRPPAVVRDAALDRVVLGNLLAHSMRTEHARMPLIGSAITSGASWAQVAQAHGSTPEATRDWYIETATTRVGAALRSPGRRNHPSQGINATELEWQLRDARNRQLTDEPSGAALSSLGAAGHSPKAHRVTVAGEQLPAGAGGLRQLGETARGRLNRHRAIALGDITATQGDPLVTLAMVEALAQEGEDHRFVDTAVALENGAAWSEIATALRTPSQSRVSAAEARDLFNSDLERLAPVLGNDRVEHLRSIAEQAPVQARDMGR